MAVLYNRNSWRNYITESINEIDFNEFVSGITGSENYAVRYYT